MRSLVLLALLGCASTTPAVYDDRFRDESGGPTVLGEVTGSSVLPIIAALRERPAALTLIIDSPGGSVYAGLALIEEMQNAQYAGTQITCVVPRLAASMAAVILEACDTRLMGRQAAILFHTASVTKAAGNVWELQRLAREIETLNKRIAVFIVGRLNIGMQKFAANVQDRDWLLGYEEAREVGAVDAVLP